MKPLVREWTKPFYGITHWQGTRHCATVTDHETFAEATITLRGTGFTPQHRRIFRKTEKHPDPVARAKRWIERKNFLG